ncbi:MAG: AHH domain-containing protein [Alistipes sp.]|nr:AHH domain-containing protein [Alistipes sp.]
MRKLLFIMLFLFAICGKSQAENRAYTLTVTSITVTNFEHTYSTQLTYDIASDLGYMGVLVPADEFQFGSFTDSSNYVEAVTNLGSAMYIKFRRRDTSARIQGTLRLNFYAKPSDDATHFSGYTFTVSYTYNPMTAVDPGTIKGPIKYHEIGEHPNRITSVYCAIPLEGTTIDYSWEKKNRDGSWVVMEGKHGESLYPDAVTSESDFYRRKATDSAGNSAYSNTVEILPMFNAGEIGISYTDSSSSITLTNVKSPNSSGATIGWQASTNLGDWANIGGTSTSRTVTKPTATTYYRRSVTSQVEDEHGEPIIAYSNTVCYSTERPAYIQTKTYRDVDSLIVDNAYYDGLGRLIQDVGVAASPSGADFISHYSYDHKGREATRLLPFSYANNGDFIHNAGYKANTFHDDDFAATTQRFDNSPLDRIVQQFKPGEVYQGETPHFIAEEYGLNVAEEVRLLSLDNNGALTTSGYHPVATLRKQTTTNEDGNQTILFTDSDGRTILSRGIIDSDSNTYADTYYVYDAKKRLRWVVSPMGSDLLIDEHTYAVTNDLATKYCYIYLYDDEDRIIERHIPGREPIYYTYDEAGRLASTYDATLQALGLTQQFAYDHLDRLVRTYYAEGTTDHDQHISIYDTYPGIAAPFVAVEGIVGSADLANSTRGLLTFERIDEVYDEANTSSQALFRTYYYDQRDRVVQTITMYPEGITCRTSNQFDYVGNPLTTVEQYTYGDGATLTIRTSRTFDSRSRQLTEQTTIDDAVVNAVLFSYDELGRVSQLQFNDALTMSTTYNLQGWISRIDARQQVVFDGNPLPAGSPLFRENLAYYNPSSNATIPSFSGNITEQRWTRSGIANVFEEFGYTYDRLGRLTDAEYREPELLNIVASDQYGESLVYDKNSNILSFDRTNNNTANHVIYHYSGNRIMAISNGNIGLGEFQYDGRGNITYYPEQDLQISYNLCNLPKQLSRNNAPLVNYAYLADGTKYKAQGADGDGFVYTGSLRWRLGEDELLPESVAITGGRAVCDTTDTWAANYYICDHLGSVRTVTDGNGTVLANYDYLPYGTDMSRDAATADVTDYRFTGKELQRDFGANLYDSFARFQHNNGRFLSIDPKAESFYHISPYTYCAGNPVGAIDSDGKAVETVWDVLSLIEGARSLIKNARSGNMKAVAFDTVGVIVDAAAVVIPGVPGGVGMAMKGARTGVKIAAKYSDDAVQLALKGARSGKLRKALNLKPGSGDAHHIIPVQLLNEEEVVKSAVTAGFDFNGTINGIEVMQHHGSHQKYTEAIRTRIKNWMEDNKNYTPEDAKDFIEELTTEFRNEIFEYKKLK